MLTDQERFALSLAKAEEEVLQERFALSVAKAEAEIAQASGSRWARDLPGYLMIIALALLVPLMSALAWHHAGEVARRKHEGKMIALLVDLGADPIKARCAVEKITADNRQLCEKLAKE